MWLQFFFSTTSPYAMNICIFIQINSLQPHDSNITCIKKQTWQRIDNQPKQTVSVSNSHTHTYTYSLFQAFKWKLLNFLISFQFCPWLILCRLSWSWNREPLPDPETEIKGPLLLAFTLPCSVLFFTFLFVGGGGGGGFQIPMERSK